MDQKYNPTTGRWFMRQDGVLFIAVDDVIADYEGLKKNELNPPINVLIAALEASKAIAIKEYDSLKINQKNNDQGESIPQN